MKRILFLIATCWAIGTMPIAGKEPKLSPEEKLALAKEGLALRSQSVHLTSFNTYYITDSAKLDESIQKLYVYTHFNLRAETKYCLALAENYYLLGMRDKAMATYQSRMGDGLSQLRLGELIYRPDASRNDLNKVINYLTHGLSMPYVDTVDYTQAAIKAKEILPMCYHIYGDDDNARRHHRAYTGDSEAEAYVWLYQIYWGANDTTKAQRCAEIAVRTEPNNPMTNETIAGYYFNLHQHDKALPYWQKAAKVGSDLGHIRLAQAYHNGKGCEKNDSLAIVHLEAGLKTIRWTWAQKLLAQLYLEGDSITNPNFNVDRALYWLTKAAEQDDWQAKTRLAENLSYWGRQPQYAQQKSRMLHEANKWAIQLSLRNRKDSVGWQVLGAFLGDSLLSHPSTTLQELNAKRRYLAINAERDREICTRLAEGDYIDAIVQLGKAYSTGLYRYTDFLSSHTDTIDTCSAKSFYYWQKGIAVAPDNEQCIRGITDAYTYGLGTSVDILKAKKFWDAHGMYNYAGTYFYPWRTYKIQHGDADEIIYMFTYYDITKLAMTPSEALMWLKNAAQNGDKDQRNLALWLLGNLYEKGEWVEKDYPTAVSYYKQSAALDNGNANHRLGNIYKNGECDVPRSTTTAAKYYRRSYQITNNQDDYWEYMSCTSEP